MPRKVDADDLELFAINTGEFYQKHLSLVGKPLEQWLKHVMRFVVTRYHKEIEPIEIPSNDTMLTAARNLMGYYRRDADETKALADSDREAEQIKRGEMLIKLLGLKLKADGRVDTQWGDKTPRGLFLTVQRIVNDDVSTFPVAIQKETQ